jgi:hypothetical protein
MIDDPSKFRVTYDGSKEYKRADRWEMEGYDELKRFRRRRLRHAVLWTLTLLGSWTGVGLLIIWLEALYPGGKWAPLYTISAMAMGSIFGLALTEIAAVLRKAL